MSEIIEEIVDSGTASATDLIMGIKGNAELSIEEAHAIIGIYYPEIECSWRLMSYCTALYKVGGIGEVEWGNFRDYIYSASMETLGLILPQIRIIADIEITNSSEIRMFEAMIAQLETEIAKGNPTKTEPDEEAMNFYNSNCMDVMMYNQNVEQLAIHEQKTLKVGNF